MSNDAFTMAPSSQMAASPVRKGPILVALLIGVAVGAAVASVAWMLVRQADVAAFHAEFQARPAHAIQAQLPNVNLPNNPIPNLGKLGGETPKAADEERTVMELAKEWVQDLERDRTTKLYNSMAAEYRKKTPRDMFETMIHAVPMLSNLWQTSEYRDYKLRKSQQPGAKYEFYFTGRDQTAGGRWVNVTMLIDKVEGEWLMTDLEVQPQKKN
jgi:hypothetical protein